MPDIVIGPLVGGSISLVSALAGVWFANLLSEKRERRREERARDAAAIDRAVAAIKTTIWVALRETVVPMPWPNVASLKLGQDLLHTDLTVIPDAAAVDEAVNLCARLLWHRRFGLRPLLRWSTHEGVVERQRLIRQLILAEERIEFSARKQQASSSSR